MSESERIKRILENRIMRSNDTLAKTAKLVEIAPLIQNQKEQDEVSLEILNNLPLDIVEEISPKLLTLEIENDELVSSAIPELPIITDLAKLTFSSTASGTALPYVKAATNAIVNYPSSAFSESAWIEPINMIIDSYTNSVRQREYLATRLDKINRNLGNITKIAMNNFDRCQNGMIGVDHTAIHLRDVIEQVWGGLKAMAVDKNTETRNNMKRLELKKEGDRELVAELLTTNVFPKLKMISILSDMYELHFKLSDRNFGKNPLNKDFPLLKTYYSQWLSILDSISALAI